MPKNMIRGIFLCTNIRTAALECAGWWRGCCWIPNAAMVPTHQSIDQFKRKHFRAISRNLGEFILAQLLKEKRWMVVFWLLFLQTRNRLLYTTQSLAHSFRVGGGKRSSPPKPFWNCSHCWLCSGASFPSAATIRRNPLSPVLCRQGGWISCRQMCLHAQLFLPNSYHRVLSL